MSDEVWDIPIVVGGGDAVPTTFFENIRQNIVVLGRGNGRASIETATLSSTSLTLPNDTDETFFVSGTSEMRYVSTTGRQIGNRIHLIKATNDGQYYYGASSVPSGFAKLYGNGGGSGSFTWYAGRVITLVYSGYGWHHDAANG